jgi:ferredoxin
MFQVRIHGRGGQGVVTAAELLSVAAFLEDKHAQAFPSFGSERTGSPVVSFCRIDDKEIRLREPILEPDGLIVQDPTLFKAIDVFQGLRPGGYPGIFAGGDMVPAERTVTVAVGHGKKAARHIDAWLRGGAYEPAPRHEIATFDLLNAWYYADAPKTMRPMLEMVRRRATFEEVTQGLDETNALYEARRCLSCGNCFECDNCYGICPDNAVIKLGPGN